jgi:hypothetical protein
VLAAVVVEALPAFDMKRKTGSPAGGRRRGPIVGSRVAVATSLRTIRVPVFLFDSQFSFSSLLGF